MVYAFRYGKVIIVSPMINALAPVITIVLSLAIYRVIPNRVVLVAGMALAAVAVLPAGLSASVPLLRWRRPAAGRRQRAFVPAT